MHLAISPVLLGQGENFYAGIDLPALGFKVTDRVSTPKATHITLVRR